LKRQIASISSASQCSQAKLVRGNLSFLDSPSDSSDRNLSRFIHPLQPSGDSPWSSPDSAIP